ncbi:MAG: hypothetical protein QF749_06030 [Verrucomicrobiota bacterium]|jgi:hypothetical protein|nr:hypothetical protein [Verrucomicrobiota bacterium]MDP6252082.1 hypothetical protein [Verrucomicrobiota bacterium]MDP7177837.1 hypothetical protein [Verrucomicrobiota bacterium]MDP7291412.1 hypothetical protein [Verrucomicrobiota bacterium]MDP7441175.1 hypothetical protein [Verrucomicrobiota bacterium]|tara:strand:+ start:356 stop:550 length:195 start_codon:yes stop_codon:yes gene_type:complete
MSLKTFHLVFILVSILFSFVFGVWGVMSDGTAELMLGVFSLVGTVGMSVYLFFFLKKFKHISYL